MKKYNKIVILTLIFFGFLSYGNNNVFANRPCANGGTCIEPDKSEEQANSDIVSYLTGIGFDLDNIDYALVNSFRKPRVDCARCGESGYSYDQHKIIDFELRDDGVRMQCNNNNGYRFPLGGGSPNPISICPGDCNYVSKWDPDWTDCNMTDAGGCLEKCTQTNPWKPDCVAHPKTYHPATCVGGVAPNTYSYDCGTRQCDNLPADATKPAPETKEKEITKEGCTEEPICGTANGYVYQTNDLNWLGKTFCNIGNPNPGELDIDMPTPTQPASWECQTGSTSVSCSATKGLVPENKCGDGIVQKPNFYGFYEICDDGNAYNYDGCKNDCTYSGLSAVCGDGTQDVGEDCDDGNTNNYDECPNNCKETILTINYCGDGVLQKPNSFGWDEKCDDGSNISGDGCSSTCTLEGEIEGGYCGDGFKQSNEICDDGNTIDNDECKNNCLEANTSNPGEKSFCGDGIRQTPNSFGFDEKCDDGDTDNNDLCTNNCTESNTSTPGELEISATISCNLTSSGYANDIDTNTIYAKITVLGGVEGGKDVIDLGTPSDFVDLSNNLSDRVYKKGNSSLTFTPIHIDWNPSEGETQVLPIATVTSVTPFKSCGNKLSFNLGGQTIVLNNVGYNFKKPFIGELKSDGEISLGTKLRYTISGIPMTSGVGNYSIGLKLNNISYLGENITLQDTKLMNYTLSGAREFETRINSKYSASNLNQQPKLQVILPIISYISQSGSLVRFYLSPFDSANDRTPLKIEGKNFIGIKIIGGLQGIGKYEFTGQGKNISNLYPSDLRTQIRKKAYDHIKNMTSGTIINKVKYVNGRDEIISGDLPYETLVVINGNVIISGDLNNTTLNKKLGIIVLKDNYDVNTGYTGSGNVLVNPNVTKINAMIYADGGFMSADANGSVYNTDSIQRTYDLNRQLTMNGILFTRNTIGGAQYVGGYYTLPGGKTTPSFDKAMVYDLNYLRRGNIGCIDKSIPIDGDCSDTELGEIKEGFIIKYDSKIQTDPPKLFSK